MIIGLSSGGMMQGSLEALQIPRTFYATLTYASAHATEPTAEKTVLLHQIVVGVAKKVQPSCA
jgi:hypothetical protein